MGSNDKYIESLVSDDTRRSEALRIAKNKAAKQEKRNGAIELCT